MKSETNCRERAEGLQHFDQQGAFLHRRDTRMHPEEATLLRLDENIYGTSFNTIKQKEKSAKNCSVSNIKPNR